MNIYDPDDSIELTLSRKIFIRIIMILLTLGIFVIFFRNFIPIYGIETKGKVVEEVLMGEPNLYRYQYFVKDVCYTSKIRYDCEVKYTESLECKVMYLEIFPALSYACYNGKYSGCNK